MDQNSYHKQAHKKILWPYNGRKLELLRERERSSWAARGYQISEDQIDAIIACDIMNVTYKVKYGLADNIFSFILLNMVETNNALTFFYAGQLLLMLFAFSFIQEHSLWYVVHIGLRLFI